MLYGYPKPDPEKQVVFYQRGIGTYNPHLPNSNVKIPVIDSVSAVVDQAIAWSLRHHILDGYKWLMKNYREGDRICMFAISSLGAMLGTVGLLPLENKHAKKQAFETYKKLTPQTLSLSGDFIRRWNCRTVIIEFMGLWDTVNSVGLVTAKKLPYTAFNRIVKTFRHAVALDERRARFKTNMWSQPRERPSAKRPDTQTSNSGNSKGSVEVVDEKKTVDGGLGANNNSQKLDEKGGGPAAPQSPPVNSNDPQPNIPFQPDVDQVWFTGSHCDVGGGSVLNGTRPNLAHIPLRWMVRECFKANTGIIFYTEKIAAIGLDPRGIFPEVKPRSPAIQPTAGQTVKHGPSPPEPKKKGLFSCISDPSSESKSPDIVDFSGHSEEELDLIDSLAAVYDQLIVKRRQWWLLETYPLKVWSAADNKYVRKKNVGKGRNIMTPLPATATFRGEPVNPRWCKVRIHRSVKTRMECPGDDGSFYVPKALLGGKTLDKVNQDLIEWVD
ncbi:hypothetical protein D9619_004420 [Psilocybe cf. subviscida]|uniref:T6SS Phospholipase effector Tle1-like catalytic domain-containing protein n=1 Tax=Psilocybe cf. subviscida TaxID=2480587 RepID=A0A8H5F8B5_9AGAR|nr:hypothetical protein D9619_004420 [Psilocybe cf. subviscida]